MNKEIIIRYLIYIINIPLYYISYLFPKNKNIWIFGAWFGEKYTDNSKVLFEYVNKNDDKIKPIWLTRNTSVYNQLKNRGFKVYYSYSIYGYYYTAISDYIFVSTGMHDVNRFVATSINKIQLWHGTPLKKILKDVETQNESLFVIFTKLFLFPFNVPKYKFLLSSSENINNNLSTSFGDMVRDILVLGYPRNDNLFNKSVTKTIIFLPTHRQQGNMDIKYIFDSFDSSKINKFLLKNNYRLYIKLHYYDLENISVKDLSNIKFITEDLDLYDFLSKTHILITDYSSVYFDFLLLNRPIIFTPFDIDEYISKDRELYYDYDKVTPGPKCKNWDEVIDEINEIISGKDEYQENRQEVNNNFNRYKDSNSSKRIYEYIKSLK
jgi:CDP-glycerol glycerophosphotransferase (TagB/SpsB family)